MSVLGVKTIEARSLSDAWLQALDETVSATSDTVSPLLISVADFEGELPPEDMTVRQALDELLIRKGKYPVAVSSMTIFPWKLWNRRGRPACRAFCALCTEHLAPRMRARNRGNRNGIYFERMMAYEGTQRQRVRVVNQLEFIIELLKQKRRPRRSALQITCFDPAKDHTGQPVRGFPCLQQVSVSHDGGAQLAVNAYYPTQYILDRGYGNYLGLCQLGAFIAHQVGMQFVRLNCFVGRPDVGGIGKAAARGLLRRLRDAAKESRPKEERQ